jgi:hypothetical protein
MKRLGFMLLVIGLAALPALAQTRGGGTYAGTANATTTSTVYLTIPGVVGIDVETDVTFDLNNYVAASGGHADGSACTANTFPPPAACTGSSRFDATASDTTTGAPGATPTAGNVWMMVFCNKTTGTLDILDYVDAAWTGGTPGPATSDLRTRRSAANNTPTVGNASLSHLTTSATTIGVGTLAATFGWTRVDQYIDLDVLNAGTVTWTAGSFNTLVHFRIQKS